MSGCIFCKIEKGQIPSVKIFEDAEMFVISDIQPQAPHHYLVIPREHIESLDGAFPSSGSDRADLVGRMLKVGTAIARQKGLLPGGFRAVVNTLAEGGQSVFHLHVHILGGKQLDGRFA